MFENLQKYCVPNNEPLGQTFSIGVPPPSVLLGGAGF